MIEYEKSGVMISEYNLFLNNGRRRHLCGVAFRQGFQTPLQENDLVDIKIKKANLVKNVPTYEVSLEESSQT